MWIGMSSIRFLQPPQWMALFTPRPMMCERHSTCREAIHQRAITMACERWLLRSRCSALLLLHGVEFCHLGPLVLPGNETHAAQPGIPDGGYVAGACVSACKWCAPVH